MTHTIDNNHILVYQKCYAPVVATIVDASGVFRAMKITDITADRIPRDVISFIKQLSKYKDSSYYVLSVLRGRPNTYLCRAYRHDAPNPFLAEGRDTIITFSDL